MQIERVPVTRICPAPYNPRVQLKPGDAEYQKLSRSLQEFGVVEPLVWNARTGNLVGGHQRFSVLVAGGATEVEVSVVDLPLEREKALNLALNKITGRWDEHKLAELLEELLQTPELDLGLTGFDAEEADALIADMARQSDPSADESFDLDAALRDTGPAVTQPGDLIILGRDQRLAHRLLCGDCTDPAQVRRVTDGNRAVLMATDPPYLVGYTGCNHPGKGRPNKNKHRSGSYGVHWDDADANPELYDKFLAAAVAEAIRKDAALYCWHASRRQAMLEAAWTKAGAFVHQQIIWVKNRPVLSRSWYGWEHEPCFFGWLKGNKPPRTEEPMCSTVWRIDTPVSSDRPDHPTPKPLEVFEIPMRQHTRPGEVCYEPFAGSGTQIIAAQRLGRRCVAMEVSPKYCDVIVRRFIAFAGEAAVAPEIAQRYRSPKPAEVAA